MAFDQSRKGTLPFKGKLKDISDFADVYRNQKKSTPTPASVMEPDGPSLNARRNLSAPPSEQISGDVLRDTTSRLYSQARPDPSPTTLFADSPRRPKKKGPASAALAKIKPAEDFEDEHLNTPWLDPDFIKNLGSLPATGPDSPYVGAPTQLPPGPSLSPQEFAMLGGSPDEFGAVDNALKNLPQAKPMAPRGSGIDASELFKDLADDQDRRILGAKPSTWLGAGALGASFALGPQAAELAGAGGTLVGPLARAGVGAMGGAGGAELTGGDVGAGALIGSVLGPMTEDAIAAASPILGRAISPVARRLSTMYDEPIATAADRAPTALLKADELVDDLPTAVGPAQIPTVVRGGTQTQALPRAATGVTNINAPPNRAMTDVLNARPPVRAPSEFPQFGSLESSAQGALPPTPPRAATSMQRPPPLAPSAQTGVGNRGAGWLGSGSKLDRLSGRVLRNPLAAGMLLSTAGMGGALGGLGMGAGANIPQASAAPPPRAVQLPTPQVVPPQPPSMLEPSLISEPNEYDLAQAIAESEGTSFEALPAEAWQKYLAEARALLGVTSQGGRGR